MKISIISDTKFGDRAYSNIIMKFRDTSFLLVEEHDKSEFLDEVNFDDYTIESIKKSDLLISYIRHPDVVAEICEFRKPTIIAINLGKGYLEQMRDINPSVVMPESMCKLSPNTKIPEIDKFASEFGVPRYNISLDFSKGDVPIFSYISLRSESPCTATKNSVEFLIGKELSATTLNDFGLNVNQLCKEPLKLRLRASSDATSAGAFHIICLLDGLRKQYPKLFENCSILGKYTNLTLEQIDNPENKPVIFR